MDETPAPNVAAMVALVAGVLVWLVRLMGCFAMFLGLGLPFQLLGLALDVLTVATGVVGIALARRQSGNGMAMAAVGTALGGVDLLVSVAVCLVTGAVFLGFIGIYAAAIAMVLLGGDTL